MDNFASNARAEKKRIIFLDHLRIFAFISVLAGHKFYDQIVSWGNDPTEHAASRLIAWLLLPLIQGGGAGVVVFFLISGYIITRVLQTEATLEFLIKRIFRIYPLYIVAVLIQYSPLFLAGKIPDIPNLIKQLLLIGDLFGTSYTLNGVEWTLRIEMLFYLYMAILHKLGFVHALKKYLPYIFILTIGLLNFIAPIPSEEIWSKGYLTIYSPFLLLGSVFLLYEMRQISLSFFLFFIAIVFYHYFDLIEEFQPRWLNAYFSVIAVSIFTLCWSFKRYFVIATWGAVLSDMTYAVYLFHNWFFEYTKDFLSAKNWILFNPNAQALIILLLTCYAMVVFVEKPGIRLGRKVLVKLRLKKAVEPINANDGKL